MCSCVQLKGILQQLITGWLYHTTKNCRVAGKDILVHTFTNKFQNVHTSTRYIHVWKSCTRTYKVHTIYMFSYWHVQVHTRYVLVRTFSKGFVQGVRIPDVGRPPLFQPITRPCSQSIYDISVSLEVLLWFGCEVYRVIVRHQFLLKSLTSATWTWIELRVQVRSE